MKKLFILILSLLPLMGFAFEQQTQVQFPQAQFQSTSSYQSVTSYTPQITEVGATNVYGSQSTSYRNNVRRNVTPGSNTDDPNPTPVGDVPFIFMLSLCLLVILYKQFKKNDVKYIE